MLLLRYLIFFESFYYFYTLYFLFYFVFLYFLFLFFCLYILLVLTYTYCAYSTLPLFLAFFFIITLTCCLLFSPKLFNHIQNFILSILQFFSTITFFFPLNFLPSSHKKAIHQFKHKYYQIITIIDFENYGSTVHK